MNRPHEVVSWVAVPFDEITEQMVSDYAADDIRVKDATRSAIY